MLSPLGQWVLVRRDDPEKKIGSIVVPDNAQVPPREAEVLALGPGYRSLETGVFIETTLKAGQRVLLPPYGGVEVDTDVGSGSESLLLIKESDILGVF